MKSEYHYIAYRAQSSQRIYRLLTLADPSGYIFALGAKLISVVGKDSLHAYARLEWLFVYQLH